MPDTLYIGDCMRTVLKERDFIDLIEEFMGDDARSYAQHLLSVCKDDLAYEYKRGYEDGLAEGLSL